MKLVIASLLVLTSTVFGASQVQIYSPAFGPLVKHDMTVSPLTTSFAGGSAQMTSGLSNKSHFCFWNTNSTLVIGALTDSACGSGTAENFVVPGSNGACFDNVGGKSKVCLKSSSGTLSSGVVYLTHW